MQDLIDWFNKKTQETISHLKEDIKSIRTGKANPSLIENIIVEAYQGQAKLKLKELAAITNYDNFTLVVKPFDLSVVSDIERALLKSPLGITPRLENNQFKIFFPSLTQEQRLKYIKLLNQIVEEKRNIIRKFRDEIRKKIKQKAENKELLEDEKFRVEKAIDEETKKAMIEIDNIRNFKEKEITTL